MALKEFLQRRLQEVDNALAKLEEAEALSRVAEAGGISQEEEHRRIESEKATLNAMKKQLNAELAKAK